MEKHNKGRNVITACRNSYKIEDFIIKAQTTQKNNPNWKLVLTDNKSYTLPQLQSMLKSDKYFKNNVFFLTDDQYKYQDKYYVGTRYANARKKSDEQYLKDQKNMNEKIKSILTVFVGP